MRIPTAIIVGGEPRKVVTIARSQHRQHVRSIVALAPGETLHVSSRAISGVVQLEGSTQEAAQLLRMLVETEAASWVVPTSDSSLSILCAGYDEISRLCAVCCPAPQVVQRVLDKPVTLEIAARCGVPAPVTVAIENTAALDAVLPTLQFPIIAKPGDKGHASVHDFKTRRFASADELHKAFSLQPRFGEGLLFQTYHAGQGVGVELLMHGSTPIAAFQHRRLSENPPSGGVAVVAVAESVDPRLLDYSVRLLNALEWEGVAMVEFRHDSTTGETALMEVNGRFWGSLPLNTSAGVDFPLYAWQLAQGITPAPPTSYPVGLRVRWTAGALERAGHAFSEFPEDRISFGAALKQLLVDFAPGTKSAMWSWSDPLPAIQEVSHVLKRWSKDAVKFGLRAIIPRSLLDIAKESRNLPADRRAAYVKRRLARTVGATRAVSLPSPAASVIFVCHGNIMRSAAAAGFLRDELRAAGISNVKIGSAGTNAHDGRPADARAQDAARQLGLSLREHTATRLTKKLVAEY